MCVSELCGCVCEVDEDVEQLRFLEIFFCDFLEKMFLVKFLCFSLQIIKNKRD